MIFGIYEKLKDFKKIRIKLFSMLSISTMANFKDSPHFETYDDYYTPHSTWELIEPLVRSKGYESIFEPFILNAELSPSLDYWKEKGYNVIGDTSFDFLEEDIPTDIYDCIVSNPPFDKTLKIPMLEKLVALDKPFILVMNSTNIFSKYFFDIFGDKQEHLEIIHPNKKLHFKKLMTDSEGNKYIELKKNCSFYSCFVAYKMDLGLSLIKVP